MKKYTLITLFALFLGTFLNAQKVGHLNSLEILDKMPERKQAAETIEKEGNAKRDAIKKLEEETQKKIEAFQIKADKLTEVERKDQTKMTGFQKEYETLQAEVKKIESVKLEAGQTLQKKGEELMKPIEEKLIGAINKVAKAKGLAYVLDSSQQVLLYIDTTNGVDLSADVKKELGIQ
jgi:outer membrane protein